VGGMRIGFDATAAATQGAGIGRYSASLLRALLKLGQDNSYTLTIPKDASQDKVRAFAERAQVCVLPFGERLAAILWHRLRFPLPIEVFSGSLDVFHSPDYLLPPLRRAAGVATVHDVSFLKVPECADPSLRSYLANALPASLARADVVLADSKNTAQDLIEELKIPEWRIRVVYPGVGPLFCPEASGAEARRLESRYHITKPYVLAVGTVEPRKNYRSVVAAVAGLIRGNAFDGELVVAGKAGWQAEESLAAFREAQHCVRYLGRVPDGDLPALYRQAIALVYASHYEGFGLPPLEAMACGTPVLVARNSSLPEVVGEAGLYCGTDAESIADQLSVLLNDEGLRAHLRNAGLERAKRFSWEQAAREVIGIYEEVA